ncbi:MAG: lipid-A-disaccharide synthase [Deltaproteobacteria bacterium]|nr:lipid-A-disaccharide synthase [Deltaproteobacteria bacterium]
MAKSILMISAEASGDLHGSALIKALLHLSPSIKVKGMGGERMREAGLTGIDSTKLSVVGIVEVFKKIYPISRAFSELKRLLRKERFDCCVLIDYPDFNLRFARAARKEGVKVVYYISPQVWAWRKKRVYGIARTVDKMLVIFPFEETLYRKAGVQVEYVGHPLLGEAVCGMTKEEAKRKLGAAPDKTTLSILPGSRTEEIKRHLKPMVQGAELLQQRLGTDIQVFLPAAPGIGDGIFKELTKGIPVDIKIIRDSTYTALRASDAAVVASGTATLETALIGTPMVIIYKVSPITYLIGRLLVEVDSIGLPNIILNKKIVPELVQKDATGENISLELLSILDDPERQSLMKEGYEKIKKELRGGAGETAPEKAARAILGLIGTRECGVRPGNSLANV